MRASFNLPPIGLGQIGCVGRVFSTLFFLVFLLFGLAFEVFGLKATYDASRPYTWQKVECVILASEAKPKVEGAGHGEPYLFEVKYRYRVNGREYVSEVCTPGAKEFSDYSEAQRLAEKYQPGSKAICYVNPSKPTEAMLERQPLWLPLVFILFPLIFVAIGAGGVYFIWRGARRKAPESIAQSISKAATGGVPAWLPVVFFLVFFLFGGGMTYPFLVRPLSKVMDAKHWQETPCTVLSSRVKTHSDSDGTTYSVDILYEYAVSGKRYRSNRYDFMGGSSSGYGGKKAVVDRHPPGGKAVCYVNPSDPTDAVLDRELGPMYLLGLIPVVFCLVGVVGLFFTVRKALRGKAAPAAAAWQPGAAAGAGAAAVAWVPAGFPPGAGPVELRPTGSPIGKLVGIAAFAVVWNGIISIFVSQAVGSWRSGHPDWFLTVFMIPFVLAGLASIGGIVYFLLAAFNPRVHLTVSSNSVPLGGSLDVEWVTLGRSSAIDRLRVYVEGREEATYRRGTSTCTDKKTFATIETADTTDPTEILAGKARLAIPSDSMHSFESNNNKITWSVKVHGTIERWPDVDEEFKILVRPAEFVEVGKE